MVDKITSPITPLGEIDKINEVIEQVNTNTTNITGKQDTLVSGTNIKTVNGNSLLGSGNITITGGANQDLSNLTNVGNNRLHALKGYEDAGELLTDAEGLEDVNYYAHSTFDRSKFTVVGSPNITDDGIASGFSSSNYIVPNNLSYFASAITDFDFYVPFKLSNYPAARELVARGQYNNSFRFLIAIDGNRTAKFNFSTFDSETIVIPATDLELNVNYIIKLSLHQGTLKYGYYKNNTYTETGSMQVSSIDSMNWLRIGSGNNNAGFVEGSIDLKRFSITVDGVEVFSGNKTGIDTIKPDDYQVVGTPTIGADGVASGFSSSNYIKCPFNYFNNKLKIRSDFYWDGTTNINNNVIWQLPANTWSNCLVGASSSRIAFYLAVGSTNTTVKNFLYTLSGAGNYTVIIEWTGTTYIFTVFKNNVQTYTDSYNSSSNFYYSSRTASDINIGYTANYGSFNAGSIDLNAFKIYVDGNLVYQPCLKIPYTESKTGSKIVDSIYRDRIVDMYNQFGYAPYYTLSDMDFTLPQGEIYGMIERKVDVDLTNCTKPHIVETYVNGTSWYRVYSDGWCEQGGVAYLATDTSVTVNLLKAFSNTNYGVQLTSTQTDQNNQYNNGIKCTSRLTGSFVITQNQTAGYIIWQACGYIN